MKTLRQYIIEFQEGKTEVLNELIDYKETKFGIRFNFKNKDLNDIYNVIRNEFYYLDNEFVDGYFAKALFRDDGGQNMFDKVDLTYKDRQIKMFLLNGIKTFIRDQYKCNDQSYYKHIVPENQKINAVDDENAEFEVSTFDLHVLQRFNEIEKEYNEYDDFIKYIGGDLRNLLTDRQKEVWDLRLKSDMTQEKIAKKLGCTQENVQKISKAIDKRMRKEFRLWKSIKALTEDKTTYKKIHNFLDQIDKITDYDMSGTFDYFGYTIEFLKENYRPGEQKVEYAKLHMNKKEYGMSVMDALIDYCKSNTYQVLEQYIMNNNDKLALTKRRKDSFVKDVLKSFNSYIEDTNDALKKFAGDADLKNFANLFDKIKDKC